MSRECLSQGSHVDRVSRVSGGLFVKKGLDADFSVGVVQIANKMRFFSVELRRHRIRERVAQEFLQTGQHIGRALVESFGPVQGLGQGLTRFGDLIDQARRMQLGGADFEIGRAHV